MKKLAFLFAVILIPISAAAQNYSTLSLQLAPNLQVPVGENSDQYNVGGGVQFSVAYKPPISFPLYVSFDLGYTYIPIDVDWSNPMHTATIGAGLGLDYRFLGRLAADVYFKGGYYQGFLSDSEGTVQRGGNPYVNTGAGLSFYVSPRFRVGFGSSYTIYFGEPSPLYSSVGFYLGTSYRFPLSGDVDLEPVQTKPAKLKIQEVDIDTIFPVFYKYYDDHAIGSAVLENKEKGTVENIEVSVYIKQYMDNPKNYEVQEPIKRGEERRIDLYALFNEKVLEITEGAKVSAEFSIDYDFKGNRKHTSRIETITLQNRNASIWDDDRRAAAFITARDPVVLRMSKNVAGMVRDQPYRVFGDNFMLAIAIHNALSIYGISYVVDPNTPYEKFHENKQAIDFLQFPRQTLEYRAGDCDDLSILYAALLESLSVDTALIPVPGHIYIAVNLDMKPTEARKIFFNHGDLIFRDGNTWLPLEVTLVESSFINAWKEGAREWHKYEPLEQAGFYPVSEAWQVFEPVGLPGEAKGVDPPQTEMVEEAFTGELALIIQREIDNQEKDLTERIVQSGNNPRLINQLGILYARYGLFDEAEQQFKKVLQKTDYTSALVNMGNIHFIRGEFKEAYDYYQRARKKNPDNPKLLLNIALVQYELEQYENAQDFYEKVRLISPETAQNYEYLGTENITEARAADIQEKGTVIWEE